MQNILDKILEGNRLKTIAYVGLILGGIVSIIIFSNSNKQNKSHIGEDGTFNLLQAMQDSGLEYNITNDNSLKDEINTDYAHYTSANMTDDVVANLMYASGYMTDNGLKATNTQIAIMTEITNRYLDNIKNSEYKKEDLNLIDSPTTEDLSQFSSALFESLKDYSQKIKEAANVEDFIKVNKSIENSLLSIYVPTNIVKDYLNLLNSFYRNVAYSVATTNQKNDPLKLEAFKGFTIEKNLENVKTSMININTYLNNQNK